MEPSIRPVERGPNAPDPLRRRQGEGAPFDLERELGRRREEPPAEGEPPPREPTPVSPPDEDEAGTHLDLTA